MCHLLFLAGILLLLPVLLPVPVLLPAGAHAQVTIDLRALEALPHAPPPSSPSSRPALRVVPASPTATAALPVPPVPPNASPAPAAGPASDSQAMAIAGPARSTVTVPTAPVPPIAPAPTVSAPPTASAPPAPTPGAGMASLQPPSPPPAVAPPPATLPSAAPPVAVLAPIQPPVAPAAERPPTPPPVTPTAATTATPEASGLRLIFKPNESDLSPAANGAIGDLVKSTPSGNTVTYNVVAYAEGIADDPSVARRVSLSRGLSVRAALMADGVASTRIYIRALGASNGDAPPDRVDLTVLGLSGTAAAGAPKP
jgi:outer membrane protein OmpA-like peptidoglycan-associated protein